MYGIWGSQGVTISEGVYIPYDFDPKPDHRFLWIKILHLVAFGEKKTIRSPEVRRLRIFHTRGQNNYISKLGILTRQSNIPQRIRDLENLQSSSPSEKAMMVLTLL